MIDRLSLAVWPAVLGLALVFSACGGDDVSPDPDIDDAGSMDAASDGGQVVLAPEGEGCTTDSECQDGLGCQSIPMGDTSENQARICLRECGSSTECGVSVLNPPASICGPRGVCVQELAAEGQRANFSRDSLEDLLTDCQPGLTGVQIGADVSEFVCLRSCAAQPCRDSTLDPPATICGAFGYCVQELASEGAIANFVLDEEGEFLSDCEAGTELFRGLQVELEDDEFACIRRCQSDSECTTPGIEVCNVNTGILVDPMGQVSFPGVCSRFGGLSGQPCSARDATRACSLDVENRGLLLCADFFDQAFNQPTSICTQLCGDTDGDPATEAVGCLAQAENLPVPRCALGGFVNPNLGICSDNCTAFPNNCAHPAPSGGGGGNSCFPIDGPLAAPSTALCLATETSTTVLPIYNVNGLFENPSLPPTSAENCAGRENQCPADSFCWVLRTESDRPSIAGCVYGCDPSQTPASGGCEGRRVGSSTVAPTCTLVNSDDIFGFCAVPL